MSYTNKLPIIVWCFPWDPCSGGIIACHKLVHMLREMGEDAHLWVNSNNFNEIFNKNYNMSLANNKIDPKKAIVVYPEIVNTQSLHTNKNDNPLGAKKIIRWLLYTPNCRGIEPSNLYSHTDIFIHYAPRFAKHYNSLLELCIFDLDYSLFDFENDLERSGTCFINRKGAHKIRIVETNNDCVEIKNTSLTNIIPIFRSKKIFYSYDSATVTSLHASMCGCLSIVIPDENISADQYRKELPMFKYGVAYGTFEDELAYAVKTQPLVKEYLKTIQKNSYTQIKNLLDIIEPLRINA